ncbi:MAG TPA: hypothetical protein DCE42_25125 [Myxococcales bacterium]|nr:hypothetical protein [Deltaproteobacteria bacterium]MBU53412.1 hypothetical protein [Deltaproteobacteria bacterium]HAA58069.1 hypothetical protein [Myxococcales bacterium]|tara:strand:+ start:1251 stop:2213 length:963 start_codon:yes stop_codon:yes gene_type:complete
MKEEFSRLRALLSQPTQDQTWARTLSQLLKHAHKLDEDTFCGVWLPYTEQHAKDLMRPLRLFVQSLQELEEWHVLCPFAELFLDLKGQALGNEGCQELADEPLLLHLRGLILDKNKISILGVRALAASSYLSNVRVLRLSRNQLGGSSCEDLVTSPHLSGVEELELGGNQVGLVGCRWIGRTTQMTQLKVLGLSHNKISDASCKALVESKNLSHLEVLDLRHNELTDRGCRSIAASYHLGRLRELMLAYNDIGPEGFKSVLLSRQLPEAVRLHFLSSVSRQRLLEESKERGLPDSDEFHDEETLVRRLWEDELQDKRENQ